MIKKIITVFVCLTLLLSIGGVYATWRFAETPPAEKSDSVSVSMLEFEFKPEEILPGGQEESVELGENHFKLMDLILNEKDKGYGLNINNNVLIHQYLKNTRILYSNQKISGGNLKFILDPQNNTHGLYYCIEKVSATEYHCYTFSTENLLSAGMAGTEIEVYRTILVKTDLWRGTKSYYGYAKVRSLSAFGQSADPKAIPYSIDVDTWHT